MNCLDHHENSWREWNRQHDAIHDWIRLRDWKLFLTLVDKKRHPSVEGWRSKFRTLGAQGYDEREEVVRDLLNRFRRNLGIKRSNQFYWIAKHEFGPQQNDPHVHVLIDWSWLLAPERLEGVLQPMRDGSWMQNEGFDLCFRLKNDPQLPILIQDLEKVRAYFGKDESEDTRADQCIWSKRPPKVDGSLAFLSVSFRKQVVSPISLSAA